MYTELLHSKNGSNHMFGWRFEHEMQKFVFRKILILIMEQKIYFNKYSICIFTQTHTFIHRQVQAYMHVPLLKTLVVFMIHCVHFYWSIWLLELLDIGYFLVAYCYNNCHHTVELQFDGTFTFLCMILQYLAYSNHKAKYI